MYYSIHIQLFFIDFCSEFIIAYKHGSIWSISVFGLHHFRYANDYEDFECRGVYSGRDKSLFGYHQPVRGNLKNC